MNTSTKIAAALHAAKIASAERLAKLPRCGPYLHAEDQIKFIEDVVSRGESPTAGEIARVNIDLMSIKELDYFDAEYSALLCELSFLFKRL